MLVVVISVAWLSGGCGSDGEACGSGAAVCQTTTLSDTIAVNTHEGAVVNQASLAKLRAAGVRVIRNDLTWANVERSMGTYDFTSSGYDALVAAAQAEGMHILFILDYGNPLYGPERAVISDAGRAAYAAFAAAAAGRYGGHGHAWEIWNEPNLREFWSAPGMPPNPAVYAQLVAATVPAIRRADPSGRILIAAVFAGLPTGVPLLGGVPGIEFLGALFTMGVHRQVDAITAHFYRPDPPETVAADVGEIRALMQQSGTVLPLWSGEWGYSTYDPNAPATGFNYLPAVSLDRQASYLVRMILTNFQLGLATSVWYDDHDMPNPDPGNIEDHFGLMSNDLEPKPAYVALATLSRLLGSATHLDTLPLAAGKHAVVSGAAANRITAFWQEDGAREWRLQSLDTAARLLARDGTDITPANLAQGTTLTIEADAEPLYALGDITLQ